MSPKGGPSALDEINDLGRGLRGKDFNFEGSNEYGPTGCSITAGKKCRRAQSNDSSLPKSFSCPELLINTMNTTSSPPGKVASFSGFNTKGNWQGLCRRIKPKTREEFSIGRIQSWSDFAAYRKIPGTKKFAQELDTGSFTMDGKNFSGDGAQRDRVGPKLECSKSTTFGLKANLKVYSRRSTHGLRKASTRIAGESSEFSHGHCDIHNSEDHTNLSFQSSSDSTTDYSDTDSDLEKVEVLTDEIGGDFTEEEGLEGLRYLMGSNDMTLDGRTNIEDVFCKKTKECEGLERKEGKQTKDTNGSRERKECDQKAFDSEGAERRNVLGLDSQGKLSNGLESNLEGRKGWPIMEGD